MGKVCEICSGKHFAKNRCKLHYVMPSKLNPKPIKAIKKAIKPFSDKKLSEMALYRKLRDKYFLENPVCEFKGCHSTEIDLHHKKSRSYFLNDVSVFMSCCRKHHTWIHENDKEARELGYLLNSV